jgi:hypothetical protein
VGVAIPRKALSFAWMTAERASARTVTVLDGAPAIEAAGVGGRAVASVEASAPGTRSPCPKAQASRRQCIACRAALFPMRKRAREAPADDDPIGNGTAMHGVSEDAVQVRCLWT